LATVSPTYSGRVTAGFRIMQAAGRITWFRDESLGGAHA